MTKIIIEEQSNEFSSWQEEYISSSYQREYNQVEQTRRQLYQQYSDPLMAKYLRDEATKDEWLASIEKIKDENPYPIKDETV